MTEVPDERQLLQEISAKLDKVVGCLAIIGKDQNEQITTLRNLSFDWPFIGTIVGLNSDAARMRYASSKSVVNKDKTKVVSKYANRKVIYESSSKSEAAC